MEIDEAVRGSDDLMLVSKYKSAVYTIQRALALYSIEEIGFSFNGGKDSTVLLHLLRAGYFLHRTEMGHKDEAVFPIRTIYFESSSAFPEIDSFTYETAASYGLRMDIIRLDFKSGLEGLLKANPIKAIFLGVRTGDPTAVGQEQFTPSSPGWPPFMRVNPVLDWSYRDVWAFLLICKVPYCSLYDHGYTSIGSIHDTVPNEVLRISNPSNIKEIFKPAYLLSDGRLERAGRVKKSPVAEPGKLTSQSLTASLRFGSVKDHIRSSLGLKLQSIGWAVTRHAVIRNDIDSVAEEVKRSKASNDMVFIYGGFGLLHMDVTVSGVAKAFGVRLALDEEFEAYMRHIRDGECNGELNKMAQLPEGISELLHHDQLPMPLIKCQNVIILTATNVTELDQQWDFLIESSKSSRLLLMSEPFISRRLRAMNISDVQAVQPLSKLCLDFLDVNIGSYRETRNGPLVITFRGKDGRRLDAAVSALHKIFQPKTFLEAINDEI